MRANELIVVQGHEHPLLLAARLQADDLAWVSGKPPEAGERLAAKARYRQADAPCRLAGLNKAGLEVEFDSPQWAVTPGQSVVMYRGQICLGGGVIV